MSRSVSDVSFVHGSDRMEDAGKKYPPDCTVVGLKLFILRDLAQPQWSFSVTGRHPANKSVLLLTGCSKH